MEASRRLAKRKNTALAGTGNGYGPAVDVGNLFGVNGSGHVRQWDDSPWTQPWPEPLGKDIRCFVGYFVATLLTSRKKYSHIRPRRLNLSYHHYLAQQHSTVCHFSSLVPMTVEAPTLRLTAKHLRLI
jgi:hypothetical protein